MDTIRNYLEAMFASMPNTVEVKKAKDELLSMMEDKYNELIEEGQSENAAVGTVISEFGNLDELAQDLGLTQEVEEFHLREEKNPRRFVTLDEVQGYFDFCKISGIMVGVGVMLCILSVLFPIVIDELHLKEGYGILGLFTCVAVAVGLFVFRGILSNDYSYIRKQPCQIDIATAKFAKEKKNDYKIVRAGLLIAGITLCIMSVVPPAIFDGNDLVAATSLFLFVGIGVFLIVYSSYVYGGFNMILNLNDQKTISGRYGKEGDIEYVSPQAEAFMEVYWSTVTCIYLIFSFVTMKWHLTWLIWVVAGIIHKILKITLSKED